MWDGSVQVQKQMFEWKLLYGLPSELIMTVNVWNCKVST